MTRIASVRGGAVLSYRFTRRGLPQLLLDPLPKHLSLNNGRVVLLIHGFNVTEDDAVATYRRFCAVQQDLADLAETDFVSNDRAFIEVDWPGGIEAPKFISWAGYPEAVSQARTLGPVIAEDLNGVAANIGHISLEIVAHSLGCRVAIEVIRALNPRLVDVRAVVFQAAAVDVVQLGATPDALQLRRALSIAERVHSLYSGSDLVLRGAFPSGQQLALENILFTTPVALGRAKWDSATILGESMRQYEIHGAGHSDYWGAEGKNRQVRHAQYQVRSALGFHPAAVRRLPSSQPLARDLPEDRKPPSRSTILE